MRFKNQEEKQRRTKMRFSDGIGKMPFKVAKSSADYIWDEDDQERLSEVPSLEEVEEILSEDLSDIVYIEKEQFGTGAYEHFGNEGIDRDEQMVIKPETISIDFTKLNSEYLIPYSFQTKTEFEGVIYNISYTKIGDIEKTIDGRLIVMFGDPSFS